MKVATLTESALFLLTTLTVAAQPSVTDCSKPSVLQIRMKDQDVYYQLDQHTSHRKFTLGEVAVAARSCRPDKMIFVVAGYDVPPRFLLLPGKEQITRVRYFLRGPGGDVQEVSFGPFYQRLPLTPDVIALPDDVDSSPQATHTTPRGTH